MNADKLKIEYLPIDSLIPYARNPRKNEAQVDRMADAIKEFGFRIPVLAKSDGTVVDGHLRIKAAKKLGIKDIPVVLADGMNDAQVKAFRLLSRNSSTWADWDDDFLRLEMEDLKGMDFDLEMTGFEMDEIDGIFKKEERHQIKKEELRPFKKTHILLSFPPEKILELQPFLESILAIDGIEYEQASN